MITKEKLKPFLSEQVIIEVASPEMWGIPPHPEEQLLIQRSVDKRKREFSAGRACARQALSQLGITDFPLLTDEECVPIWPEGIIGSISHTQDCCIAVATPQNHLQGIGIDIEHVLYNTEIENLVCVQEEKNWLESMNKTEIRLQWLTVLFSAKESIYKALYPKTRTPLDFTDLHIAIDTNSNKYEVDVLVEINPLPVITGRYLMDEDHVFTSCEYSSRAIERI